MSTPVNKGEGWGQNSQNPVNVVYECPLRNYESQMSRWYIASLLDQTGYI